MRRRIPLWATLLPLAGGIAVWAFMWNGHADGLKADLQAALPTLGVQKITGFPYRLEATIEQAKADYQGAALSAGAAAETLVVNRVPWQRDRQVLTAHQATAHIALAPLAGGRVDLRATDVLASVRIDGDRLARFSGVWHGAQIRTGLFAPTLSAETFETHLREIYLPAEAPKDPDQVNPQAQLVLSGKNLRIGEGAPLTFALDSKIFAKGRLQAYANWVGLGANGGSVQIEKATLADSLGEIASFSGRIRPSADGRLLIEGVIETICPANVRAAVAGTGPVSEQRTRKAEKVLVSGAWPGAVSSDQRDPSKPPAPVRAQIAACPRLL